jgi:thioredoxin-related protein
MMYVCIYCDNLGRDITMYVCIYCDNLRRDITMYVCIYCDNLRRDITMYVCIYCDNLGRDITMYVNLRCVKGDQCHSVVITDCYFLYLYISALYTFYWQQKYVLNMQE